MKERLVLVGNGMAGMRTVEELLAIAPDKFDITVFGSEPHGNFNRIMLSPVLAGEKTVDQIMINDLSWYARRVSACTPVMPSSTFTVPGAKSAPPTVRSHPMIDCCWRPDPIPSSCRFRATICRASSGSATSRMWKPCWRRRAPARTRW